MLTRVTLDRNSDTPLFRQLSVAIEMRIIDGELADGTSLPSVRRLATQFEVAPITVVQAYKELQSRGLVKSIPKRGYFVTIAPDPATPAHDLTRVTELIDAAFAAAQETGIEPLEFLRIAGERIRADGQRVHQVAVVGYRAASLEERVAVVRESLSDLHVGVRGVAFDDLEPASRQEREALTASCGLFLVSVGEVEYAASLLGHPASRIVPMTRVLREDVVDFILAQPETARIGIIAESPDYAQRILSELSRIREFPRAPLVSVVTDTTQVGLVLEESDAVLVGSLAAMRLGDAIPPSTPWIRFVFLPDQQTLARLRARLT